MKKVRCAIYTRKSSEEGLEQDFNSLDAQREACAAYVLSQASEGWQLLPEHYDDGGLSGGTLARPALQRLLADVAAGSVDIIVVYKVDRLTRSLLDFAKLVEALDRAEVSFVSVTQSFNTTTSMRRLTLNMLLSFAQFEREVTAERIRDKLAASKAKGMWMGGTPPLGYLPDGRSLAIEPDHARIVQGIYERYLKLGSVPLLAERLRAEGVRTPVRHYGSGKAYGGCAFTRGQLYFILKNPTYAGKIAHKEIVYPGKHEAIIDQKEWDRVQTMLADHTKGDRPDYQPSASPLAGKLFDAAGEPLLAAHTSKGRPGAPAGKVRYRYYISRPSRDAKPGARQSRIPAREIETLVANQVATLFTDPLTLLARLDVHIEPALMPGWSQTCAELAVSLSGSRQADAIDLVRQVRLGDACVDIEVEAAALAAKIGVKAGPGISEVLAITLPVRLRRSGLALRLLDQDGCTTLTQAPDQPLLRMIVQARGWWAKLGEGQLNVEELASQENVHPSRLTRILRLAFLSPALVEAIIDGTIKPGAGRKKLIGPGAIPSSWPDQEKRYLTKVLR